MSGIIMLLVSIALTIVHANSWVVVPDICLYICYGVTAILAVYKVGVTMSIHRKQRRFQKDFYNRLNRFF